MKNILLIGSGGRESAILRSLLKTKDDIKVYCAGTHNNPYINENAELNIIGDICSHNDITELTGGAHGELHADGCIHDNTNGTHTCGHAHNENRATELRAKGYTETNASFTVANNGTVPDA